MQVLILGDDHGQQARLAGAMMKKGFQVICVESAAAASSYIRSEMIDVLILTETRSGRIGQSCACVTQSRNRAVSVIVISGRTGAALEELFEEVPQLYGVMGLEMAPGMVAALALASILPQQVGMPLQPQAPALAQPPDARAEQAEPSLLPAPYAGQGAALNRTLIQPRQRPAQEVAKPVFCAPAPTASVPLASMTTVPVPTAPLTTVPVPTAPLTAAPVTDRFVFAASVAAAPVFAEIAVLASAEKATAPGVGRGDRAALVRPAPEATNLPDAGIGPDLAALERELDLVNRDRPSVLAASIADELPRWSQSAPKLAMLTDWTPTGVPPPRSPQAGAQAAAKAAPERRLALGTLLQ